MLSPLHCIKQRKTIGIGIPGCTWSTAEVVGNRAVWLARFPVGTSSCEIERKARLPLLRAYEATQDLRLGSLHTWMAARVSVCGEKEAKT